MSASLPKFRKKPVEIEAVQWTGNNVKEVMDFMAWRNASHDQKYGLNIRTLEGTHHAAEGDWIIKGVKGEFYPCKPDIFEATYDPVDSLTKEPQETHDLVDRAARAAYEAHHFAGPLSDQPIEWGRGGYKTEITVWHAVVRATIASLSSPASGGELVERVAHLEHVIDRDRYIVAAALNGIRDQIRGRTWLLTGRGPYEWDDDRYREEFGAALEAIEKAAEPLAKVAWDKSDCTRIEERVNAAREAAREMLNQPTEPRVMIAADLGLPCPACSSLEALSPPSSGERAQIVAWLRGLTGLSWASSKSELADAIEQGDHLNQGAPGP